MVRAPYAGMDPDDMINMITVVERLIQRRSEEAQILRKIIMNMNEITYDHPRHSCRIINGHIRIRPMLRERMEMRSMSYKMTIESLEGLINQLDDLKRKSQTFPRWR